MTKIFYKFLLLGVIITLLLLPSSISQNQQVSYPGHLVKKMIEETAEDKIESTETTTTVVETETGELIKTPNYYDLDISFISQAPTENWDMPFQEACEEAALIIAANYYGLETKLDDPTQAEERIIELVDFIDQAGLSIDLTLEEMKTVYQNYYDRRAETVYSYDFNFIKKTLLDNHPIIMPFAGRELDNPYYTPPGPVYHFLVIKGFDDQTLITHDPGTKHGKDYIYSYNTIRFANHDWNEGDVENGQKGLLILY